MKFPTKRFTKFAIVGTAGLGIGLATIYLSVEYLKIAKTYAWFISTAVTILFNFILNNLFTWRDRKSEEVKKTSKRLGLYYIFNTISVVVNYAVYRIFLGFDVFYILAALAGVVVATGLNFFWADRFVWRAKHQKDLYEEHSESYRQESNDEPGSY